MLHISCNMGTRDLADMYALGLWAYISGKSLVPMLQLILVKAPLRVLYDKIQHEGWGRVANTARGEAECCICHKTTP